MDDTTPDLSALLRAWGQGNLAARDRLMPLVYDELRRCARRYFRHESANHLLQPTALVHETYMRLARQDRALWANRAQFYATVAQMMRRILVDHARAQMTGKRSAGSVTRLPVGVSEASPPQDVDVMDLDNALEELASFDQRKARVVELRFFAGLSLAETGHVLHLSVATVEREWIAARAWLHARLRGDARCGSDGGPVERHESR